ncbi:Hypothetical protein CUL131002_0631c [Corynebacterium ulcerans]|nr:Hypothetical protein CUL131002_0631c [Corynebacterium ulcerans]
MRLVAITGLLFAAFFFFAIMPLIVPCARLAHAKTFHTSLMWKVKVLTLLRQFTTSGSCVAIYAHTSGA